MLHASSDYNHITDPSGKIPADEPVFLLRAQDQTAAPTLRHWIKANRMLLKAQKSQLSPEQIASRKKTLALADAHAYRMEEWATKKPATF